ncbi:MAG TPA: YihY/virulence factor BrkB family protein [Stellaceae bacterium]|nr:YihY/virulence factor BrkB family protein [Stellaceae bacterium]
MWSEIATVMKSAVRGWARDRAPSMGAAVAYYTVFSMAPILLVVIAVAGMIFGERAARGALVGNLKDVLGPEGAQALEALIRHAAIGKAGPIATVAGLGALMIAATAVLMELQAALNVVWKVRPEPGINLWLLVKHRMLCLAIILASGVLLALTLAAGAAISASSQYLQAFAGALPLLLHGVNTVLTLATTTVLFGMIYKILPDARVHWRDVWLGAAVTSVLFTIGRHLISAYIGSKQVTSVYGAAGALVIILLWVYYSTQILLFGAEITKAYADWRAGRESGRTAAPAPAAD